jgi:Undecaprenyl pyrophosphate synthase
MKNETENQLKTLLLIFNEVDFLEDSAVENLFDRFPVIQNQGIENLIVYIDILDFSSFASASPASASDVLEHDAADKKELLIRVLSEKIRSVSEKFGLNNSFIISDYNQPPTFSQSGEFSVYFALGFGGRNELKHILSDFIEKCRSGELSASEMTSAFISSHLLFPFVPDFILSGSKNTLTDFMIWQTAYSEYFYFGKDLSRLTDSDFRNAFESFRKRGRRYGV